MPLTPQEEAELSELEAIGVSTLSEAEDTELAQLESLESGLVPPPPTVIAPPAVDDRSDLDRADAILGNQPELTVEDPLTPIESTDVGDFSLSEPEDVQQNELANILVSNDPGVGGDVLDTEVSQLFPSDTKLEKSRALTTEGIPAFHEAYRKGDMKEKYGIEPGFFNLGMLTAGFMLNADPADRTAMMARYRECVRD